MSTNDEKLEFVTVNEVQKRLSVSRALHHAYEELKGCIDKAWWTSARNKVADILTCTRAEPMRESLKNAQTLLSEQKHATGNVDAEALTTLCAALEKTNAKEMVYWGELETFTLAFGITLPEHLQTR